MGCMVLIRTFHTAPEQGQGRTLVFITGNIIRTWKMGTRPILQVLKMFQVFFPVPVQVQCERFLLKPYNPFFSVPVPVPVPVPDQASVNTPLVLRPIHTVRKRKRISYDFWCLFLWSISLSLYNKLIGGSGRGGQGTHPPVQLFFIFMQLSGESWQIKLLCTPTFGVGSIPPEILDRPVQEIAKPMVVVNWEIQERMK